MEAQAHCKSRHMTLFQFGTQPSMYHRVAVDDDFLLEKYYETATDVGDAIYLGLKRNSEVILLKIYRRLTCL